jgi:hypothetical protein
VLHIPHGVNGSLVLIKIPYGIRDFDKHTVNVWGMGVRGKRPFLIKGSFPRKWTLGPLKKERSREEIQV